MSDRTTVKTYVPEYQRENWRDHAEELDMSLSEFVRTMVQAGRRGFDVETTPTGGVADESSNREEAETGDGSPGVEGVETLILDTVAEEGVASWDRLVELATEDVEERLDEGLTRLQEEGRLRYSGREGGYVSNDG